MYTFSIILVLLITAILDLVRFFLEAVWFLFHFLVFLILICCFAQPVSGYLFGGLLLT